MKSSSDSHHKNPYLKRRLIVEEITDEIS